MAAYSLKNSRQDALQRSEDIEVDERDLQGFCAETKETRAEFTRESTEKDRQLSNSYRHSSCFLQHRSNKLVHRRWRGSWWHSKQRQSALFRAV